MNRITLLIPLLALPLAACLAEPDYSGNPSGPRVAIVGDGDVESVAADLHATLDPDYQVRLGSLETTTPDLYAQALAEAGSAAPPDVLVYLPPFLDAVDQPHEVVEFYGVRGFYGYAQGSGASCYVLGTVPSDDPWADAVNDWLRTTGLPADVVLADWAAVVAANPGYQDGAGNVTPSGEAALVDMIAEAVEACP